MTPVSGSTWNYEIKVPGYAANERRGVLFNGVSPDYFRAMGTPLLAGRDIADTRSPRLARTSSSSTKPSRRSYFSGENPVGKTFTIVGFSARPTATA